MRKAIRSSLLVLGGLAALAGRAAAGTAPPNIVFIFSDDQNPGYLGCYGGRTPTTHLDRLAREGALFTNAHSVVALCGPSRYSVLTGHFPGRNERMIEKVKPGEAASIDQDARINPETPSVARMLREAGYYTGFVGKWHSNFETQQLTGKKCPKIPENPDAPNADEQLQERQAVLQEAVRKAAGFEYASRVVMANAHGVYPIIQHPEWITSGGIDFIRKAKQDGRPFFLHLAHVVPHAPDNCRILEVDPRYTLDGKLDAPPDGGHPPRSTIPARLKAAGLTVSSLRVGAVMIDDSVGAILQTLEELGLLDNTLVVFAMDNGYVGKGSVYSGGSHTALLARLPGTIKPGTRLAEAVSLVDFVPTCLDLAGASLPKDYRSDGLSWMPMLRGESQPERKPAYMECGVQRSIVKGKYRYLAFRPTPSQVEEMKSGKAKMALDAWGSPKKSFNNLIIPYKPAFFEADQLYDLETDPMEHRNLAADPKYARVLKEMQEELWKILETLPTPFPREPDPFLKSEDYRRLVEKRRADAASKDPYPDFPKIDWEKNLNFDGDMPEDVDPSHPSAWQPGKTQFPQAEANTP